MCSEKDDMSQVVRTPFVELHQTGTYEGRSIAPWQLNKLNLHISAKLVLLSAVGSGKAMLDRGK